MPRRKLFDSLDHRERAGNVIQREITIQSRRVQAAVELGVNEDGLEFRAEQEIFAAPRDVKRLDAHAVARKHQALFRRGPDGDREHAAKPGKAGGVPFEKAVQHGFGVGAGVEAVAARFEFRAHFQMVVNFAVEDDDGIAIRGENRLVAGIEVDDFQAGGAERDEVSLEHTLLVGAAMG
jgi:hypothetical protein